MQIVEKNMNEVLEHNKHKTMENLRKKQLIVLQTSPTKKTCSFLQLDIKDFSHSSMKTINSEQDLAKQYIMILNEDINIIKHRRKSIL